MIIRRVRLSNAGPFLGDWEVELSEGATVVVAEYEGEDARSNRAGKSFFAVDAPLYALFGIFRGKTDEFAHRLVAGEEDAYVEVEVSSSDGSVFVLRRGRTARGEPIRSIGGARLSERDYAAAVEGEVLGLSLEEYRTTCLAAQGEVNAFMRMTPDAKRRFVSPWFRTDRWVPRADLARKRLGGVRYQLGRLAKEVEAGEGLEAEVAVARAALEDAGRELSAARENFAGADAKVKDLERRVGREAEARAELGELRAERDALSAEIADARGRVAAEVGSTEVEVATARSAVAEARSRKVRIDDLERRETELGNLRRDAAEFAAELRKARADLEVAEGDRERLLKVYYELRRSRTGVCPVLREPCTRVEASNSEIDEIKSEGLESRAEIARVKKVVEDLAWKADMASQDVKMTEDELGELERFRRLPAVEVEEDRLAAAETRRRDVLRRAERLKFGRTPEQKSLRRLDARVRELEAGFDAELDAELVRARELKSATSDAVAEAEGEFDRVRADLVSLTDRIERRDAAAAESKALAKTLEDLAWAAYAFGASGIPSRELENAFGVAEDEMNAVLGELRTPVRVEFSPSRELKDWEPACLACGERFAKGERRHVCRVCGTPRRRRRRDELRLDVVDGGVPSSFELDSGGGQVLLSVGTRLGLARLPGRNRAVRCEHLIVDEPDGALDAPNRAALHALLRDRAADLGIRQVILITHADVRREFENVVVVRRFPGEDHSAVWSG